MVATDMGVSLKNTRKWFPGYTAEKQKIPKLAKQWAIKKS